MHSALRTAIEQGNLDAVQDALARGADVEEADMHGHRGLPLRLACFLGHAAIVTELLRHGADVNAANGEGSGGPIRMAARGNHPGIVELLTAHGAASPEPSPLLVHRPQERRQRTERRRQDVGPPTGMRERRAYDDRRTTQVHDMLLDDWQWEKYFSGSRPIPPAPQRPDFDESASMVFDRARD